SKGFQRSAIADVDVLGPSNPPQPRVLGTDCGVVETRRHGMRQLDVAILVLQHERARALQDAGAAPGEARGVSAARNLFTPRLDADEPYARVVQKGIEDT